MYFSKMLEVSMENAKSPISPFFFMGWRLDFSISRFQQAQELQLAANELMDKAEPMGLGLKDQLLSFKRHRNWVKLSGKEASIYQDVAQLMSKEAGAMKDLGFEVREIRSPQNWLNFSSAVFQAIRLRCFGRRNGCIILGQTSPPVFIAAAAPSPAQLGRSIFHIASHDSRAIDSPGRGQLLQHLHLLWLG